MTADRCRCSHARSQHTRGTGQCWLGMCGCAQFRDPTPIADSAVNPDVIGPYGLEPDSVQCADCGDRPVPVDHNELCEPCAAGQAAS